MKFIHTADLHLASPFQGLTSMPDQLWKQIYNSTFAAFRQIVDAAIAQQVDFVLITGDIYDGERKSIAAVDFFRQQVSRLNDHHIPVFLSYGNHDFQKNAGDDPNLPANVHVFGNRVSTSQLKLADGTIVAVTGFSYGQRWIDDDLTSQFPVKGTVDWQIGMLHGALYQAGAGNHYAPFTLDELKSKNYDYWALGHIHKHQVLSSEPPIVYSGNPQGRHKNEGGVHGYYLVHDEGNQLVPEFKALNGITWEQVAVDLSECGSEDEVDQAIETAITPSKQLQLVEVVATTGSKWRSLVEDGSLLDHLQDELGRQPAINWWPYQINLAGGQKLPELTNLDQDYWQQAEQDVFTDENLVAVIKPLLKHAPLYDQFAEHRDLGEYQKLAGQLLGKRGDHDED